MIFLIQSILAGLMIGIGGTANLIAGDLIGAILFSVGLYAIILFKYALFTGKIATLDNNGLRWYQYIICWIGNFLGAGLCAAIGALSAKSNAIYFAAQQVTKIRTGNTFIMNVALGILCGLLVAIAVRGYKNNSHPITVILPVTIFVFCGFNHCVADMFYFTAANEFTVKTGVALLATTLGNIIGCGLLPLMDIIPRCTATKI